MRDGAARALMNEIISNRHWLLFSKLLISLHIYAAQRSREVCEICSTRYGPNLTLSKTPLPPRAEIQPQIGVSASFGKNTQSNKL